MDQPSSVFVTYIVTTPDQLWAALTQGSFTKLYFFGRSIDSDWQVGSLWRLLMDDGRIDSRGKVLECVPPSRLSISWRVEWLEEFRQLPDATVLYQIEPLGAVVRLTVSEFHHPTIDERYKEGGRTGWPIILSGLKSLLETGRPLPPFQLPAAPTT